MKIIFQGCSLAALQTFFISYFAYTSIHGLRTTYSSVKPSVQDDLNTSKLYLGAVDCAMLLSLGIGHFLHAIYPQKTPVKFLWISLICCASTYALFPLIVFSGWGIISQLLVFGILFINGFIQSYTWPNLLMVVNKKFKNDTRSTELGFWGTNTNTGNIIGYLIWQLILGTGIAWYYAVEISALFILLNSVVVFYRIKQIKFEINDLTEPIQIKEEINQSNQQFKLVQKPSILVLIKNPFVTLLTIIFSLTKSVIYGLLLWLPLYFEDVGLKKYAAQIPIAYNISSIIGSIVLGKIYSLCQKKSYILAPSTLALLLSFLILKIFNLGAVGYFILISFIGAILGGIFNIMASNITVSLTQVLPQKCRTSHLGFFAALIMAVGNITTALTQILVSFVSSFNQSYIFAVFGGYEAIAFIVSILLLVFQFKKQGQQKITTKNESLVVSGHLDQSCQSSQDHYLAYKNGSAVKGFLDQSCESSQYHQSNTSE